MRTEPVDQAASHLPGIVAEVGGAHVRYRITSDAGDVVLLPADEFEALEETLAVLSDPQALAAVLDGRAAVERGDTVSGDDVRALVGLPPLR